MELHIFMLTKDNARRNPIVPPYDLITQDLHVPIAYMPQAHMPSLEMFDLFSLDYTTDAPAIVLPCRI